MSKPAKKDDASQMTFAVFCPSVITSNGSGYTITPGKPVLTLTPRQLASQFGVDRDTVYRWRQEGLIPDQYVKFGGMRRLLFFASVVPFLEANFKARHQEK